MGKIDIIQSESPSQYIQVHKIQQNRIAKIKRKKREGKRKKNGRKYVSSQGCGKQKDLAYLAIDKV